MSRWKWIQEERKTGDIIHGKGKGSICTCISEREREHSCSWEKYITDDTPSFNKILLSRKTLYTPSANKVILFLTKDKVYFAQASNPNRSLSLLPRLKDNEISRQICAYFNKSPLSTWNEFPHPSKINRKQAVFLDYVLFQNINTVFVINHQW